MLAAAEELVSAQHKHTQKKLAKTLGSMITLSDKAAKMMSVFDPRSGWRLGMTSVVGSLNEGGGLKECKDAKSICGSYICRTSLQKLNCVKMKAAKT